MKRARMVFAAAALVLAAVPWGTRRIEATPAAAGPADTIIALERAALDRWGRGDPQGYIETYAPEITYFDPFAEKRIDGIAGMRAMLAPITGKVKISRYEMIDPKVQLAGDIGVLSFNLISHTSNPDGSPRLVRWNSTEVYRRIGGRWKIVHNHWSFTRPELKQPGAP